MGRALLDKVWDTHLIGRRVDGRDLIFVDRHILHELHAPHAFKKLKAVGRKVRRADLTFSTLDHMLASRPGRDENTNPEERTNIFMLPLSILPYLDSSRK